MKTEYQVVKLIKAMFWNYSFEIEVTNFDDDFAEFHIVASQKDNCDCENKTIELQFREQTEESVKVYCSTRSLSLEWLGDYDFKEDEFNYSDNFWKTMFIEALQD